MRRREHALKVLVVGSVGYDDVETPVGVRMSQLGGSVCYFSVAANYFTEVGIIGIVGRDFRSQDRDLLASQGINLSGLEVSDGKTFRWSGSYINDINDAETVGAELNVLGDFEPKLSDLHTDVPYLFLANCDPETQQSVLDRMSEQLQLVAGDTMNHWIIEKRKALSQLILQLDVSVINEGEAKLLTQKTNLVEVAEAILDSGPRDVIIKRGEYGAAWFGQDQRFIVPAYPVQNVVDPTGAGDSFAGGFMGYIAATGETDANVFRQAVVAGSVIASFTVEGFGLDRLVNLSTEEIARRFTEFTELTAFDTASQLPLREVQATH